MENNVENVEYLLEELVGKYVEYKSQENHYASMCKEISNNVDEILHRINKNSVKIFINTLQKFYECKYVDRKTKKVDYQKLAEILSDEMFNEVVQENETTYLQIKAAPVAKISKREKPIQEESLDLPKGRILK